MKIYSIGFTQKSASEFFGILKANGIERLLDVRLNNTSQLAGFAKQADLAYFLREIRAVARANAGDFRSLQEEGKPRGIREVLPLTDPLAKN